MITFSYEIANDKKSLQGEAKAALVLRSNDEGIRIAGEKEQWSDFRFRVESLFRGAP